MFTKHFIAIAAALLLSSCATSDSTDISLSTEQQEAERLNASVDTSAVAMPAGREHASPRIPLLAIEVEITPDGIKPLGARIVRAPRIMNGAHDDVRVKVEGTDFEYTFADPLVAKVRDENEHRVVELDSVHRVIFAPLLPAATRLSIEPVAGGPALQMRGGTIELRELAVEACRRTPLQLPVCTQILAQP